MNDYSINAVITLDTSEYKKGINEAQKSTKTFSGNFQKLTKGLGGALLKGGAIGLGITAVTKGLQALSTTVKQSVKIWEDANAQQKKLAQTLKVTGAEVWTTTEDLNAMADAYQKATNYSSNDVTQMQTVLLGFKNISEDTFKSASDAILDMAEVMGMDLVSATQTVGKALDDPINGLGSLSRQGFKFSETEKELIKNLVEAGETAKAQKIILDELNTTYGGAAEKGVKASEQLKNNWKSLLQEMGRNITMSIDIEPAKKKLNELLDHWRAIQKEMADAKEYTDNLINAQEAVNNGTATYEQNLLVVEAEIKKIEDLRYTYEVAYQNAKAKGWEDEAKYQQEHIDALDRELKPLQNRKKIIEEVIAIQKQETEAQEKATAAAKEQEAKDASIAALKLKYLKLIADQEAHWELQKKVTGETVSLEEKRTFYQTKLIEIMEEANGQISENNQYYKDQQKIIADITAQMEKGTEVLEKQRNALSDIASWESKLRQQSIDALTNQNKEEVDYEAKKRNLKEILSLNMQQLEAQRAADLQSVEDTENAEEAKAKIVEYYNNEKMSLQKDYNEEVADLTRQQEEEIWEAQKAAYTKMFNMAKSYAEGIASVFSKMAKTIGSVFKGVFNSFKSIFSKVFSGGVDDALDSLLVFEDKILTFFVETLPQLPQFVASALQSIGMLIKNIMASGGFKAMWDIFENIFDMVWEGIEWLIKQITANIPKIIKMLTDVIKKIVQKIPGFISLIVPAIVTLVTEIIKAIPPLLNTVLPALLQAVLEMVKALMQNLPQIISTIVQFLPDFILGITNAIAEFIGTMKSEDFAAIVGGVIQATATLGIALVKAIPDILKGLWELAKGLVKGMWNLIVEALKATWKGVKWVLDLVVDWFKSTFGGYATGTNAAQSGYALVGEAGPELVKFNGGEQVLNARNTQKALAATGNAGNTFNVTFNNLQDTSAYAMMSQLRAYNRQMAINGVI